MNGNGCSKPSILGRQTGGTPGVLWACSKRWVRWRRRCVCSTDIRSLRQTGEAADVFSYLMGIANEHANTARSGGVFSFYDAFIQRYPGLCTQCGNQVCVCPTIPEATVGRTAKELAIPPVEGLLERSPHGVQSEQVAAAVRALEAAGGSSRRSRSSSRSTGARRTGRSQSSACDSRTRCGSRSRRWRRNDRQRPRKRSPGPRPCKWDASPLWYCSRCRCDASGYVRLRDEVGKSIGRVASGSGRSVHRHAASVTAVRFGVVTALPEERRASVRCSTVPGDVTSRTIRATM